MKTNRFAAGFFMLLAMLMIAMVGGEPINGGGDAAHVWFNLGFYLVLALSLEMVNRLTHEK